MLLPRFTSFLKRQYYRVKFQLTKLENEKAVKLKNKGDPAACYFIRLEILFFYFCLKLLYFLIIILSSAKESFDHLREDLQEKHGNIIIVDTEDDNIFNFTEIQNKIKKGRAVSLKILEEYYQKLYEIHQQAVKKIKRSSIATSALLVIAVILTNLITTIFFPNVNRSQAATYYFTQNSWSGGASDSPAYHDSNQSGWANYASKDFLVSATSSIALSATATTTTQTSDSDFNGGTMSSTTIDTGNNRIKLSAISGTQSFSYTGDQQIYVVPTGINSLNIDMAGAKGGGSYGGNGGRIQTTISVIPNSNLYIYIGGTGGYNGGASGGSCSGCTPGTNGGGASDIRIGGTAFSDRAIIAAGGGGGRSDQYGQGGSGGGLTGGSGSCWFCNLQIGLGGGQSSGGAGGLSNGNSGSLGLGGSGGSGSTSYGQGGCGGGGGYYGGGGGAGSAASGGGGGGGSSYASSTITTSTIYTSGYSNENGSTTISYYAYYSSGIFTSNIINLNFPPLFWGNFFYNASTSASTTITMKARTCAASDCAGASAFSSCSNITSGQALSAGNCATNGHQYVQYQATLSTTNPIDTPYLNDATIEYSYYPSSQTLTSSRYDSSSAANVIGGIAWDENENLPVGTAASLSLRTAANISGLASSTWVDFNNASSTCSKVGTRVSCLASAIPDFMKDGSDDRWLQYKITLTSTGANTATVDNITVIYVVNAPPEIQNAAAAQGTDGNITVQYQVKDADTASGTIAGYVYTTLEYCTAANPANCENTGAANWSQAAAVSGAVGTTSVPLDGSYSAVNTITWSPKADFNNKYYNGTYKVRVKANDQEGANNIAYGVADSIILDTTNPAPGALPVRIGATTSPAILYLDAADNSDLYMKIGLGSSGSCASPAWQTGWIAYNSISSSTLGSNPATVCVQFKDYYNNTSTIQSVVTPEAPAAVMIQDTTNVIMTPNEYRLFLAWQAVASTSPAFASYEVYKSEDNENFSLMEIITDRTTNYFTDSPISSETIYYYKIAAKDVNGNASYYSQTVNGKANGTQDAGEGGGGTPSTPPAISNVSSGSIYTTQATITWDTDNLSDSRVEYITATGGDFTGAPFQGVNSFVNRPAAAGGIGAHSVTLTGLDPGATYYFQVRSTDANSNIATSTLAPNGYSFTTLSGAVISTSTVRVVDIANTSATVNWTTNTEADSYVYYALTQSTLASSPSSAGQSDNTTEHSVNLSGLTTGATYYYYVKSGSAQDNNAGAYYSFTTTQDNVAPLISGIASTTKRTSAIVSWNTNEDSTSRVEYGLTVDYGNSTATSTTLTKIHSQSINDLLPNTTYHFRLISVDSSGNISQSPDQTFITETFSLTDVQASVISETSIGISWTTNENATSQVEYGTSANLSGSSFEPAAPSNSDTSHSITLSGLAEKITYYYRAKSVSGSESRQSPIYHFTTGDTAAPVISSVSAGSISDTSAVIAWTTDEAATSKTQYGTTTGSYYLNSQSASLNLIHSLSLSDLAANTKYYFRVISADANGNTSTSTEYNFTTRETLYTETEKEAAEETARQNSQSSGGGLQIIDKTDKSGPTISKIEIKNLKADSAIISWLTDEAANSYVEFGTSQEYGDVDGLWDSVLNHKVRIKNLMPSSSYHYRILSADSSGNLSRSADAVFSTPSFLSELADEEEEFKDIAELSQSKEEAQKASEEAVKSVTDKAMDIISKSISSISIPALESTLNTQITSIEEFSKLLPAVSFRGEPKVITTSYSASVIWETDKESNSLVAFAPDNLFDSRKQDPYLQVVGNPDARTNKHAVTIYNLEPDTLYHYQLRSRAAIGPVGQSADFTFKTQKESLEITNYITQISSPSAASFKWVTNIETDSQIKYIPYRNNNLSVDEAKIKSDKEIASIHEINIDDLESGTVYSIELSGKTAKGDVIRKSIPAFSTAKDDLPPTIYQVQTEAAISPGKTARVQAVISWMTNEPATSRVYYQKGFGADDQSKMEKTPLDGNYTKRHVVVITKFEPGSIYTFKAESVDSSGNISISRLFTFLAPRQTETVFEVIIKNFEQIFGWVGVMNK